jgi:hypothetical protein
MVRVGATVSPLPGVIAREGIVIVGDQVLDFGAKVFGNIEVARPNGTAEARFRLRVLRPLADAGACIEDGAQRHQDPF